MKLATKEDIEAPIEQVFAMLSDFDYFERSALRRGAEVRRSDDLIQPGIGMAWAASFAMRGKQRNLQIELIGLEPPVAMRFQSASPGLHGFLNVDLLALSRKRTRMALEIELTAKTFASRLFLQSLKLARNSLNKRFRLRVAVFAKEMEDRYKASTQTG